MTQLSKQQEIQMITKLCTGGGYFADYFLSVCDQMCQNIRNDYPIDMGCWWNNALDRLTQTQLELKATKEEMDEMIEDLKQLHENVRNRDSRIETMCTRIIVNESLQQVTKAEKLFSLDMIIKTKVSNDIILTQEEKDYLISKADL